MKALIVAVLASLLMGAKAPDASCSISAGTLRITGLPTRDTFTYTPDVYPVGTTLLSPDGTWTTAWPWPAAYVWERGGGPSLVKPGPGLNDYHVIALCSEVTP